MHAAKKYLVFLRSVRRLIVTANGVVTSSSPILVTLMKKALGSSETSVLTRAIRRNIPEDNILHWATHLFTILPKEYISMKIAVFWDLTPCGFCENRCLGGTYRLRHQGNKNRPTK
jgi:hypothetical protein